MTGDRDARLDALYDEIRAGRMTWAEGDLEARRIAAEDEALEETQRFRMRVVQAALVGSGLLLLAIVALTFWP